MITRTVAHPHSGPVACTITATGADIRITASDVPHASVTVSTTATDGPSHDAVTDATLTANPGKLTVALRDEHVSGNNYNTVISTAVGATITGATIIGGRVVADGRQTTGSAQAAQNPPITVHATVPLGSSIDVRTVSGAVIALGPLVSAHASTTSGRIGIQDTRTADLQSISGHIEVVRAESAHLDNTSGRISVGCVGEISAINVSGRIEIRDTSGVATVSTVSGRIDVGYSGAMEPTAHSTVGRVDVHRTSSSAQCA